MVQGDRTSHHIPDIPDHCASARVVTMNNTIYMVGCGNDGNRMYRLYCGQWHGCADLLKGVVDFCVAATDSHIVCIRGNRADRPEFTNLLQIYDCRRDSWRLGTPMPVDSMKCAACVENDGHIFHTGGWLCVNDEHQLGCKLVWRLTLAASGDL